MKYGGSPRGTRAIPGGLKSGATQALIKEPANDT
jgi:hypothetical protein